MEKYDKQRVIGKGSYGQAILIRRKDDKELFVAKEVRMLGMKHAERREARSECALLARLQHPNIVRYIEHFEERQVLYMVMEYAAKGDLDGVLRKHKVKTRGTGLPEELVLLYFGQMCLGLKYLHDRKILHRDIKAANVFITSSNVVKIGDFGISTVLRNTFALARTVCGTPYYFSPELCQNRPYNNKSDVWALGCVLYQLCTLRHPFDAANMKGLMQKIVRGQFTPLSAVYDETLRVLVQVMLSKSDKQRPSISEVLRVDIVRLGLQQLHQSLGEATLQRQKIDDIRRFLKRAAQPSAVGSPRHACQQVRRMRGPEPGRPPPRRAPSHSPADPSVAPADQRARGAARVAQAKAAERARLKEEELLRLRQKQEDERRAAAEKQQLVQQRAQAARQQQQQQKKDAARDVSPRPGGRAGYQQVRRQPAEVAPRTGAGVRLQPLFQGDEPQQPVAPADQKPRPGHRRRVSAPVSSPPPVDRVTPRARPLAKDDLTPPHHIAPGDALSPQVLRGGAQPRRQQPTEVMYGRRRSVSDERHIRSPPRAPSLDDVVRQVGDERERELQYQRMQQQKSRAVNELLLKQDGTEVTNGTPASGSSPRPGPRAPSPAPPPGISVQHGRRSASAGPAGPKPDGPAQDSDDAADELVSQSLFVDMPSLSAGRGRPMPLPSPLGSVTPKSGHRSPFAAPEPAECAPADSDDDSLVLRGSDSSSDSSSDAGGSTAAVARSTEYRRMMADIDAVLSPARAGEPEADPEFGDEEAACVPPALRAQPPQAENPVRRSGSDGHGSARTSESSTVVLDLGIDASAPLSQRAEVLRDFLDRELGTDVFLSAYRMLADGEAGAPQRCIGILEAGLQPRGASWADANRWQQLVAQLVFVDDSLNRDQL